MSAHLTSEEISRLILDRMHPAARSHLERCPECRAKIDGFDQALSGLRGSIRHWSSSEFTSRRPRPAFPRLSLAFALLCLAVLMIMRPWKPAGITRSASDDALLQQVSVDVSRVAPTGMESLAPAAFQ